MRNFIGNLPAKYLAAFAGRPAGNCWSPLQPLTHARPGEAAPPVASRHHRRYAILPLVLSLLVAACGGGGNSDGASSSASGSNSSVAASVTLNLSTGAVDLTAGENATLTATVVRAGGFTGTVTLDATGLPDGVALPAVTLAADTDSATLTLSSDVEAAAATATVTITATATGVSITPATFVLMLSAAPQAIAAIGGPIVGEYAYDQWGEAVALSADGTRVIGGSTLNDDAGTNAGHARVFARNGDVWTQVGADLDGEQVGELFGAAVAMSADGTRIVVGGYRNDGGDGSGSATGHAQVFDEVDGQWVQVGADLEGIAGGFGTRVAISANGNRVAVAAPEYQYYSRGRVAVYELLNGTWTQIGEWLNERYGYDDVPGTNGLTALALSADGQRLAVGFGGSDDIANGAGRVRVFDWDGSGWAQAGSDLAGTTFLFSFGAAIAMTPDGQTLAIGSPGDKTGGTDGGGIGAGLLRVYAWNGSDWAPLGSDIIGSLGTADGTSGDTLGRSIALSADGTRLVAGGRGFARYYFFNNGDWEPFGAGITMSGRQDGYAVAIGADGLTAATGAYYGDTELGNAFGFVNTYQLAP